MASGCAFILPPFVFSLKSEFIAAIGFAGSEAVTNQLHCVFVGHILRIGIVVEIIPPGLIVMKISSMMMTSILFGYYIMRA